MTSIWLSSISKWALSLQYCILYNSTNNSNTAWLKHTIYYKYSLYVQNFVFIGAIIIKQSSQVILFVCSDYRDWNCSISLTDVPGIGTFQITQIRQLQDSVVGYSFQMFMPFLLLLLYNYIDIYYFHFSSNVFIKFTVSFHIYSNSNRTCFWHLHPPLCSFINEQHLGSFVILLLFCV